MTTSVLGSVLEIPYSSNHRFVQAVNARLKKVGGQETVSSLYPQPYSLRITPIELLFHLGYATAAAIPVRRHPAAPMWALLRYVDIFAADTSNQVMLLDSWVQRSERGRRRAVLSEDLGIAVCAAIAAREDPGYELLDVDAFDRSSRGRAMWRLGSRRPDYVTAPWGASSAPAEFGVWESKGRSGSPSVAATVSAFASGAIQTYAIGPSNGWTIGRRCVAGTVANRRSLTFHALRVDRPAAPRHRNDARRRRVRARPELDTLLRFAGLPIDPDAGRGTDTDEFDVDGVPFVGRRATVPTVDGEVTVAMGVDQRVRDAALASRSRPPGSRFSRIDDRDSILEPPLNGRSRVRIVERGEENLTAVVARGVALRIVVRR